MSAPDLVAALKLALPYVQRVASTAPTEHARMVRQRQACRDVEAIEAALGGRHALDVTDGEVIAKVGRALHGEHYKAPLAAELGVRTDSVDAWSKGRTRVPPGVWQELADKVLGRLVSLRDLVQEVEAAFVNSKKRPPRV